MCKCAFSLIFGCFQDKIAKYLVVSRSSSTSQALYDGCYGIIALLFAAILGYVVLRCGNRFAYHGLSFQGLFLMTTGVAILSLPFLFLAYTSRYRREKKKRNEIMI